MNKSRSEHLEYLLCEEGFLPAKKPEEADVVIFNTCAVREHAMDKAVSIINSWSARRGKATTPLLIIFGCLSQYMKENLKKKIPGIDVIAGTHNLEELPQMIRERRAGKGLQVSLPAGPMGPWREKGYRRTKGRVSAYLPITYGCDNYCSYCVVPYTTGHQRSKTLSQITGEVEEIIGEGFKEIILLGQNVNSYGKDLPGKQTFEELLTHLAGMIGETPVWLRFLTSHPKDMRLHIVEIVRQYSCICPYFHLPLQAGSDRILALMNRGYDQRHYLEMTGLIRREIPQAGLGTDIIVGYPGETENDFLETIHVVKKTAFDIAYTFMYSPRPGTRASMLKDDVPPSVKKERLQRVNNQVREGRRARMKNLLGNEYTVLLEKDSGGWTGKTSSNIKVEMYGENSWQEGDWKKVRLTYLRGSRIIAQVIDES